MKEKKLNGILKLKKRRIKNYYKISSMKDSFKELSSFISPGLNYLVVNAKAKRRHFFQYIN